MKRILLTSLIAAGLIPPLLSGENDDPFSMLSRQIISQLELRERPGHHAEARPLGSVPFDHKNWPVIRSRQKIKSGPDLKKLLETAPKGHFEPYLLGETRETDGGWILISLDPDNIKEGSDSLWIVGYGVRKGSDKLIPWGIW